MPPGPDASKCYQQSAQKALCFFVQFAYFLFPTGQICENPPLFCKMLDFYPYFPCKVSAEYVIMNKVRTMRHHCVKGE